MFLTHLDAEGNDSPPILIENATAANRAVNIPEFVNIPPDGLLNIDVPAAEFYRLFDSALGLAAKREYDAAIAEWARAIAISPDDAKAHNNLGVALLAKGDVDGGLVQFRKAVEIRPEYAEAHYNLGGALLRRQLADEAIAQFRRVVEINPRYAEAHNELGALLLQSGRQSEAITHFERAVEIDPKYAKAQNNLGVALARSGRTEDATAHFQSAIDSDGSYPEPRYSLGMILYSRGRIAEAMMHWRAGLSANPNYRPILARVAWVLATCPDSSYRNGREAVALAERLVKEAESSEPEELDALGAAYAEAGRFHEALDAAQQAVRLARERRNEALAATVERRIRLYEGGAPIRDGAHTGQ
jgi:tetratricopeptide (TPR) repeat protein